MAFTEYLFDKELIEEATHERAASLKANKGFSDFPGFALGVFERRLAKDPLRYRDYGPYWPALKDALNQSGRDYGASDDPLVRETYRGDTLAQTLVMADEFRGLYLATQAVGTNQFVLDGESGESWVLFDPDMESRA